MKQLLLSASLLTSLAFVAPGASAEDQHGHGHRDAHRQHGTHVHGVAALNLALEGRELYIELDSPAANIVGFEHAPSSDAEHAALDKAVATLNDGDQLFAFDDGAGCRMETAKVESALLDAEHEGHVDEKVGEHGHGKHDRHEEHHGEGEDETHSDIEATYHFECEQPGKLTRLTVELFEAFPGMEKLNVQYVTGTKQGAAELTPADHVIKF